MRFGTTVLFVAMVTAPAVSNAQEMAPAEIACGAAADATMTAARAHFDAGQTLVEAGSWDSAERELRAALHLYNSPNSHYLLGRALAGQSRWVEAYEAFERTIAVAAQCIQSAPARSARYRETAADATRARDAAMQHVAWVTVDVPTDAPRDLEVRVGDAILAREAWGRTRAYPSGTVTVRASAAGLLPFERVATASGGETVRLAVSLRVIPTAPALPTRANSNPQDAPVRISGTRVAGIVAASAGLVAGATGVALMLLAQEQYRALDTECGGAACPAGAGYEARVDSGQMLERLGVVLIGGGAAFVATGIVLFLVGARHTTERATAWAPYVDPAQRGAGVVIRF